MLVDGKVLCHCCTHCITALRGIQTGLQTSFPGIIKSSPWCCCAVKVTFKPPPVTSISRLKTGDGGHRFVSTSPVCLQPATGVEKILFPCAALGFFSISRFAILLWWGIQVWKQDNLLAQDHHKTSSMSDETCMWSERYQQHWTSPVCLVSLR